MAYIYPFRMTSTTATLLLIDPIAEEVIIGVRSDTAWVYPNTDSLPGGFMEARYTEEQASEVAEIRALAIQMMNWKAQAEEFHDGEDAEACAIREAEEEMGIKLTRDQLVLFAVRSNSRTDTRAHVTNICFYAELTPDQSKAIPHGADVSHLDDLKGIKRFKISDLFLELPNIESLYPMAFNHFEVMMQGLLAWKKDREYLQMKGEIIALQAELARANEKLVQAGWDRDAATGLLNWGA